KTAVSDRLRRIHAGFTLLKKEGFKVDVLAPEAAIYLTIKIDLAGQRTEDGKILTSQQDVTSYLLNGAKLAVVPFSAFGASKSSPWYRLSVGTCHVEDIEEMIDKLKDAMKKLSPGL
ncbi:MAG TPA: aminotransferase class I/II-fold pyridoxal phosphate-dependent enzyme, partial [Puia sp.]|nr:aminotransferase class I/II-fold pyridoxal phosphate-dependent enzyme [Puia sp.]